MKNQYLGSEFSGKEMYSSGWRGAPAKGVGRATGARVQIPPSPFNNKTFEKKLKKLLTNEKAYGKITKLFETKKKFKQFEQFKKFKKFEKSAWQTKWVVIR